MVHFRRMRCGLWKMIHPSIIQAKAMYPLRDSRSHCPRTWGSSSMYDSTAVSGDRTHHWVSAHSSQTPVRLLSIGGWRKRRYWGRERGLVLGCAMGAWGCRGGARGGGGNWAWEWMVGSVVVVMAVEHISRRRRYGLSTESEEAVI